MIPSSVRRSLRVYLRSRDSALRGPHLFLQHQAAGVFRIVPLGSEIWEKAQVLRVNKARWMLTFAEFHAPRFGSFVQAKAIQSIAASYDNVLLAV